MISCSALRFQRYDRLHDILHSSDGARLSLCQVERRFWYRASQPRAFLDAVKGRWNAHFNDEGFQNSIVAPVRGTAVHEEAARWK
jgi:hypothetical protein